VLLPVQGNPLEALKGKGGTLEVQCSYPHGVRYLPSLIAAAMAGNGEQLSAADAEALAQQLSTDAVSSNRSASPRKVHAGRLADQLSAAQERIRDLENSFSWRLMAPARTLTDCFFKLKGRVRR
jgi:hypothetical protein